MKVSSPKAMEEILVKVKEGWCEWKQSHGKTARSLTFRVTREDDTQVRSSGHNSPQGGSNGFGRCITTAHMETNPRGTLGNHDNPEKTSNFVVQDKSPCIERSHSVDKHKGPQDKAQVAIAVSSPMKHFYRISPRRKKPEIIDSHVPHIRNVGGRIGPVVELELNRGDAEKAVIPYSPVSPVSKVVSKLGGVKLKRPPPEIRNPQPSKRIRRAEENESSQSTPVATRRTTPKKHNVRRTKQGMRGKGANLQNSSSYSPTPLLATVDMSGD